VLFLMYGWMTSGFDNHRNGATRGRTCSCLDGIDITGDTMSIAATAKKVSARCPMCGRRSRRVHSWYARTISDLPVARTVVVLHLRVRRFFCRVPTCPRRILAIFAQRTEKVKVRIGALLAHLVPCGESGATAVCRKSTFCTVLQPGLKGADVSRFVVPILLPKSSCRYLQRR